MAIEHQPPEDFTTAEFEPVYFLAGPIQGAPNWQADASEYIKAHVPGRNTHIANPRREVMNSRFIYDQQVGWEKRYLRRAAQWGAMIFWLAAQDRTLPYRKGRAYAQTTRMEFGRAIGWLDYDSDVKISLGIDPGYEGSEDYYLHTAREYSMLVFDTLENTVDHALKRSI
jgi:hypothetical protein